MKEKGRFEGPLSDPFPSMDVLILQSFSVWCLVKSGDKERLLF